MNPAATAERPLLTLRGVTKRFGGVLALDNVDFDLRPGEIHALLGENGAGKSTLIKILGGIHRPDAGQLFIEGRAVSIRNVADANRLGIRIIHQELSLAPNLSVAENIYLGREPGGLLGLHRGTMVRDAERLIARLDLHDIGAVGTSVSALSVARQQLVEITRALSCQTRILVLDEPTSALSQAETEALFTTLRRLRSEDVGIIYISHRLEEILRLADRVTVLRDGRAVATRRAAETDRAELIRWMVGRDIREHFHRPPHKPGAVALRVRNLCNPKVRDVSFELHYGQVLGLAGLVGSGRSELARALYGIDPIHGGTIEIDGEPVIIRGPQDARRCGLVMVPEDRKREGLVMTESLAFNLALPWLRDWIAACFPNRRKRREIVERAIAGFGIRAGHPEQGVGTLSGGNQQKALVARWMEHRPKVLILDEPTRGVDVGAREEMFAILGRLVESGMAVLLISSDLNEVIQSSHRVAVYRDGRILRIVPAEQTSIEQIMSELTGGRTDEGD
jgi:ABC-type sugar transport system ATPase subunit